MASTDDRIATAVALMAGFARRTGLTSAAPPRRYLWTDAFAVCNFLGLARTTSDATYAGLARALVDQVHRTLARHRGDDDRHGWISGLGEEEGARHPTAGGLRIGKRLRERSPDEPFDERLEWERDGQYFHYLTKWTHALDRMTRATGDPVFGSWARELAVTAHRAFVAPARVGGRSTMFWKASIDLARPLVPSMGQHDPLDGYVTCVHLMRTLHAERDEALQRATVEFAAMIDVQALATRDPLGIGGLLFDACRLTEVVARASRPGETALIEALLAAAASGLRVHLHSPERRLPAAHRLAFREIGLAIGLHALDRMQQVAAGSPLATQAAALHDRFAFLCAEIESFWLRPESRQVASWSDHEDISDVMLATCLVPEGLLGLRA